MSRAAPLLGMDWGQCLLTPVPLPPALTADLRGRFGFIPAWASRLVRTPWVLHAFYAFVQKPVAYVSPGLCDLIGLVVGQDNSCRYCYGAQRALLKIVGYRDEDLERLERDFHLQDQSPGERAALELARRLSRAEPRPTSADLHAVARQGLDPRAVTEVAVVTAGGVFANRISTLLALPIETRLESLMDKPLFRLVRPFVAWRMREKPRAPVPPPQPNDGPFAAIVTALGDSPAAGVVRRTVDDALDSDVLPRRTKALMVAVVARAPKLNQVN